jgi:post-segregation antitoxin (ccd killing protein)
VNVSAVTQAALASELEGQATDAWLDSLPEPHGTPASHEAVMQALDAARDEFGAARG